MQHNGLNKETNKSKIFITWLMIFTQIRVFSSRLRSATLIRSNRLYTSECIFPPPPIVIKDPVKKERNNFPQTLGSVKRQKQNTDSLQPPTYRGNSLTEQGREG